MKCPKGTRARMACRPRRGKTPRKCSRRIKVCSPVRKRAKTARRGPRKPTIPTIYDPISIRPTTHGLWSVIMPEHKGAKHTSSSLLVGSKEEACYYARTVGYNFPPHRPGVTAGTRATCAGLENFGAGPDRYRELAEMYRREAQEIEERARRTGKTSAEDLFRYRAARDKARSFERLAKARR